MQALQNKKIMVAVIVAVLLVLGGVTYWYLNKRGGGVEIPSAPEITPATPTAPTTPSELESTSSPLNQ